MKKFFLLAAIAFALVSCRSTKVEDGKNEKSLSLSSCEGNWRLTLFMKDEVAQVIANADLTIAEKGGGNFHISGFTGANYFNGEASSKNAGQIKVENVGSTRRGATPEVMEFETLFLEFLYGVDSFSVEKFERQAFETLVLKNSSMNAYAHFSRN
ncbi:MAG: META domain-containing protein [Treponemataceae bacterium]|nr:META domain-containing protein [Treponemataceae bacterium]